MTRILAKTAPCAKYGRPEILHLLWGPSLPPQTPRTELKSWQCVRLFWGLRFWPWAMKLSTGWVVSSNDMDWPLSTPSREGDLRSLRWKWKSPPASKAFSRKTLNIVGWVAWTRGPIFPCSRLRFALFVAAPHHRLWSFAHLLRCRSVCLFPRTVPLFLPFQIFCPPLLVIRRFRPLALLRSRQPF